MFGAPGQSVAEGAMFSVPNVVPVNANGNINIDFQKSNLIDVAPTSNFNFDAPIKVAPPGTGGLFLIRVAQDSVGSRLGTFNSVYWTIPSAGITFSTGANVVDFLLVRLQSNGMAVVLAIFKG